MAENMTTEDPFADATYSGIEIRLDGTLAELTVTLEGLLASEGGLFSMGLSCELKDNGQDCRDCPMATLDPNEQRAALCRVGKDQCLVTQRIGALQAPVLELAEMASEMQEIGEAALPDEYAELLAASGL